MNHESDHHALPGNALHELQACPPAAWAADVAAEAPGDRREAVVARFTARHRELGGGTVAGVLEVGPEGFGFVRSLHYDGRPGPDDVFVSPSQIRHLGLRTGHWLEGNVRLPQGSERFLALDWIHRVNGAPPDALRLRLPFANRTPLLPSRRWSLAVSAADVDLAGLAHLAPFGFGHRVLLEVPPELPREDLLRRLTAAAAAGQPGTRVLLLGLDQRPEQAAASRRAAVAAGVECTTTTFDEPPARHTALADLVLARAQRCVEAGEDVLLCLDSLGALARASQFDATPTGRLVCPGLDAAALLRPRRLFAAARTTEEGGSLTVLATAVATDQAIDRAVLDEFRNRGNGQVVFTAAGDGASLDPLATRMRREDLLLPTAAALALQAFRERLAALPPAARGDAVAALRSGGDDDAERARLRRP